MSVVATEVVSALATSQDTRIVLTVVDGLGGLPHPETGKSELETARTPHLDSLAAGSVLGLTDPVGPGITPGSGPGHLSLFGYDPVQFQIGRGALSALGLDFPLRSGDVAARGNFATVDAEGCISDRRAGRIATELNGRLCEKLRAIEVPGAEFFVQPEEGYRFLLVARGDGLSAHLTDSDPQVTGRPPLPVQPQHGEAGRTADLVNQYVAQAHRILVEEEPANAVLLRGFAERPSLPSLSELHSLRPAAIAVYPMYRGLARVAGMTVLDTGSDFTAEVETLRQHWDEYDFFFVHYKWTDSAGEDGDFCRKVELLEEFDAHIPALLDIASDVLVVAGDHSTPAIMAAHSWHPVPFLLHAKTAFPDLTSVFSERACMQGGLGRFPATDGMRLMLAHAGKLSKFGA
ncbi:MAG: phosphoglycerate mutase [Dehalococcoidia bacterium]|nr:phosphoglycerate mutase [Dehalococcoidia bacterium]